MSEENIMREKVNERGQNICERLEYMRDKLNGRGYMREDRIYERESK